MGKHQFKVRHRGELEKTRRRSEAPAPTAFADKKPRTHRVFAREIIRQGRREEKELARVKNPSKPVSRKSQKSLRRRGQEIRRRVTRTTRYSAPRSPRAIVFLNATPSASPLASPLTFQHRRVVIREGVNHLNHSVIPRDRTRARFVRAEPCASRATPIDAFRRAASPDASWAPNRRRDRSSRPRAVG